MLKYLVDITEQLMPMMIALGLIFAYLKVAYQEKSFRYMQISIIVGIVCAALMTYFKVATSKVDTGYWNLNIFILYFITMILFLVFTALRGKMKKLGTALPCSMAAAMVVTLILYFGPTVMETPHTIYLTEDNLLSSDFLYRIIGMIFAIIFTYVVAVAAYKLNVAVSGKITFVLMLANLMIMAYRFLATGFGILMAKRVVATNHIMFVMSKNVSNSINIFIWFGLAIVAVAAFIVLKRSLHVNEPYSNPAQHRKIRAKWRNRRRWVTTIFVTFGMTIFFLTFVDSVANKPVELSPIEEFAKTDDENVYVSFDQVDDGALHRFGYTADDGVVIRFIVIQKPNSSSYGIGLDACDVCGETGYYEKDGQVVCNLCDVVMNINTIGFKGGCNPIVIDYSIEDGYIVVPIEGLLEHESEFK